MRTLTTKEAECVAGGTDSKPTIKQQNGPITLPTITVTPSTDEMVQAAGGFSTSQCSFGAFANAVGVGAAGGGGYAAVVKKAGPAGTAAATVEGAIVGLATQDYYCARQIGNEIQFIERR